MQMIGFKMELCQMVKTEELKTGMDVLKQDVFTYVDEHLRLLRQELNVGLDSKAPRDE